MYLQILAIILSLIAISIAGHNKYVQLKKDQLKKLSKDLETIYNRLNDVSDLVENPKNHEVLNSN